MQDVLAVYYSHFAIGREDLVGELRQLHELLERVLVNDADDFRLLCDYVSGVLVGLARRDLARQVLLLVLLDERLA